MGVGAKLRSQIKASRKSGAAWVRLVDTLRLLATAEGRATLWVRFVHGSEVHQTTPLTWEERYPELFDRAAELAPTAQRILSFGCSTGEELSALRLRFPHAEIVGAEINPRSRSIARRRMSGDGRVSVVRPNEIRGHFDLVFALAVLQREPHKMGELDIRELSPFYSFARFDAEVSRLVGLIRPSGIFCVANAQYRIEDSSSADRLEVIEATLADAGTLFGKDGMRLDRVVAAATLLKVVG